MDEPRSEPRKHRESSLDAYEVLETLGSGSFGRVMKVRRRSDGRILVWKELHYGAMSDREKQLLVSEVNILRELHHPNIVRYYDRVIDRERRTIYIVMEHCEGGDLQQLIRRQRKDGRHIDEDTVWEYMMQLCLALRECHTRREGKILHRDIKPANLLLCGSGSRSVKLGDFGLARVLSNSQLTQSTVGTPLYMSPEQIEERAYDEKCDMWAVGCLLYELCMLHPPFEAQTAATLAVRVRRLRYEPIPSDLYSQDLIRTVTLCLSLDPRNRPSADEMLALRPMALCLRERRLLESQGSIRRREEEVRRREEDIRRREEALRCRDEELRQRESDLFQRELCGVNASSQEKRRNSVEYFREPIALFQTGVSMNCATPSPTCQAWLASASPSSVLEGALGCTCADCSSVRPLVPPSTPLKHSPPRTSSVLSPTTPGSLPFAPPLSPLQALAQMRSPEDSSPGPELFETGSPHDQGVTEFEEAERLSAGTAGLFATPAPTHFPESADDLASPALRPVTNTWQPVFVPPRFSNRHDHAISTRAARYAAAGSGQQHSTPKRGAPNPSVAAHSTPESYLRPQRSRIAAAVHRS
eukprot:NODE_477_length_2200_cov_30.273361_g439_i0.p1 GENE.NODE_477_length_2200_cov_30.273361_g439_i0~~NODE_477_length_2200_cov_30.273361_g439_i0.p1  ORF type:complete len:586 (+),score=92.02 NODE_477_length_2200_cov_30.273361_g439_i0:65-1822(+)